MAGRPKRSSRGDIEDAAAELFLEQGYATTTIDHITRRAGVSRATFFNYFESKSDLLWVPVDEAILRLGERCESATDAAQLRAAVLDIAGSLDARAIPLAVAQAELIGAHDDVEHAGLLRVAALARVCARSTDPSRAFAIAGVIAAQWIGWVRAGTARRPLAALIDEAWRSTLRES
jgi:AcrR family transcriptional regulator